MITSISAREDNSVVARGGERGLPVQLALRAEGNVGEQVDGLRFLSVCPSARKQVRRFSSQDACQPSSTPRRA